MASRLPPSTGQGPQPSRDAFAMMEYDAGKKSVLVAYLLWFVFGYLGGHRFYLGRTGSAMLMLALCALSALLTVVTLGILGFFLIGIWWLIDAFLIPGMVAGYNRRLIERLRG
jgi:TM2 domain-containing membrane protein YozV